MTVSFFSTVSTYCEKPFHELKATVKQTNKLLMLCEYLSHLEVACSAIKVEMQVLDFSKL